MNESFQFTKEDIDDINKEPEDISEIIPSLNINNNNLSELKKMIDNLPREKVSELFSNLTKSGNNIVNPDNNIFSTSNKKEILHYRLQQKLKQKQLQRVTNKVKEENIKI